MCFPAHLTLGRFGATWTYLSKQSRVRRNLVSGKKCLSVYINQLFYPPKVTNGPTGCQSRHKRPSLVIFFLTELNAVQDRSRWTCAQETGQGHAADDVSRVVRTRAVHQLKIKCSADRARSSVYDHHKDGDNTCMKLFSFYLLQSQ